MNDIFSKWIFPLHEGVNVIGSDEDVDIFLYLNENEDIIESVHCKIIVNEEQNYVGIISLAINRPVAREEKDKKITLQTRIEYELKHKSIFYLTDNTKFTLIKGTLEEIQDFCRDENIENEYQQWYQFVLSVENNIKLDLNLSKKDINNNSFMSNNNEINNNNAQNLNNSENNNNNPLLNSAVSNRIANMNTNLSPSILGSNTKEINRIGFNNFDEVPEDNIINDTKIPQINPIQLSYNENIGFAQNPLINPPPLNMMSIEENQENESNKDIPPNENENNSFNFKLNKTSEDITNINNNIINGKEIEINSIKSEIKEDNFIYDNKRKKSNSSDPFNYTKNEFIENRKNNDEQTIQILKDVLGENDLEQILKNSNSEYIKKYDEIFQKSKNKSKDTSSLSNIDSNKKK